jgi:biopolymer transport protein ExbD
MAGGGGIGGGDKRSVNAELNLVPYIDLLSTLICFLLITAVWQQIDAMSTNSNPPAGSASTDAPSPAPDPNKVDLSVAIYQDHFEASAGLEKSVIGFTGDKPDYAQLQQVLRGWKQRWPNRNDVVLHSDSQAPYKFLIGVMDSLSEADFADIGVNTH